MQEANGLIRPYLTGVTPQEDNIATIVLLSENKESAKADQSVDYLKNFQSVVDPVSFNTGKSVATITQGSTAIPNLKLDGSHEYYGVFNNFSLTSVTESKDQMTKIHMNFGGSWNAFFFGEKPTVYGFSGFFLDSREYPYYQEFSVAYDKFLSGRKCVENNFQMLISYDGKIISGYILNINSGTDANNPYVKSFNFSVLVKDESWFRNNISLNAAPSSVPASGLNYMSSDRNFGINVKDERPIAIKTGLSVS
jgi:hypothetical protein